MCWKSFLEHRRQILKIIQYERCEIPEYESPEGKKVSSGGGGGGKKTKKKKKKKKKGKKLNFGYSFCGNT